MLKSNLKEEIVMKQKESTFYEYVNPIFLSISIIGFLLYFGVDYFEIGITGLGLWGVTGALGIEAKKNKL